MFDSNMSSLAIIVPCCGGSSRYPDLPPKWLLPSHDGRPMVAHALAQIDRGDARLIITVLRQHEERFGVRRGIRSLLGDDAEILVLDQPTRSQPETVARTLEAMSVDHDFLVKDSDNVFRLRDIRQPTSFISVCSLNEFDQINPRNKSYVRVNEQGNVIAIREKEVISDLFSVGGYYFQSAASYLRAYHKIVSTPAWDREPYLADVIALLILEGEPFGIRRVDGYHDWGTVKEWRQWLVSGRTFFVALDGFLFERGSSYFAPRFEDVKVHDGAVASLLELRRRGHGIILLSVRKAVDRDHTQARLAELGLGEIPVVYDCPEGPWTLLTAAERGLAYRTGAAVDLEPTDPELSAKLYISGRGDSFT